VTTRDTPFSPTKHSLVPLWSARAGSHPRLHQNLGVTRNADGWCYQGMTFRSLKNLAVAECGASDANHTIPAAPSRTERVAFEPPMSVRTQPGHTEFTANFGNAAASCTV